MNWDKLSRDFARHSVGVCVTCESPACNGCGFGRDVPVKKRAKRVEAPPTVEDLQTIARPAQYDAVAWQALIDLGWVQLVDVTVDKGAKMGKAQGELF